jgi:hypothetical protein
MIAMISYIRKLVKVIIIIKWHKMWYNAKGLGFQMWRWRVQVWILATYMTKLCPWSLKLGQPSLKKKWYPPNTGCNSLVGTVHFVKRVQNDFSAYYSWSQSGRFNVARSYQNSNEQSVWEALRDNCRSVLCNQKLGKYSSMSWVQKIFLPSL